MRLKIEKIIIEMSLDFVRKNCSLQNSPNYHKTKQTFWKAKSLEKYYKEKIDDSGVDQRWKRSNMRF